MLHDDDGLAEVGRERRQHLAQRLRAAGARPDREQAELAARVGQGGPAAQAAAGVPDHAHPHRDLQPRAERARRARAGVAVLQVRPGEDVDRAGRQRPRRLLRPVAVRRRRHEDRGRAGRHDLLDGGQRVGRLVAEVEQHGRRPQAGDERGRLAAAAGLADDREAGGLERGPGEAALRGRAVHEQDRRGPACLLPAHPHPVRRRPLEVGAAQARLERPVGRARPAWQSRRVPAPDDRPLWRTVSDWYAVAARDLPWRRPGTSPWAVLVSEVMLQQTPVARVEPVWQEWVQRWPEPAALAVEAPGEAVRAWGRLGYPRRALRLHAAAVAVVDRHGGVLPDRVDDLLALPGIGDYTARAVVAFAHRRRHPVVDTNVRRVVARAVQGLADAPVARADLARVLDLLPEGDEAAATTSVALMELGALVCTARAPRCPACPLLDRCAWVLDGRPALDAPVRRPQAWAGSDRQVRGRLLSVLREQPGPASRAALEAVWEQAEQRERALAGLLADGLVEQRADGTYALPG